MPEHQKVRACYYAAAVVAVVILLVAFYMWHDHVVEATGETLYVRRDRPNGAPPAAARGRKAEGMSAGAHWETSGSYGHAPDTLAAYSYSGHYEDVPTPGWA